MAEIPIPTNIEQAEWFLDNAMDWLNSSDDDDSYRNESRYLKYSIAHSLLSIAESLEKGINGGLP